VSDFSQADFSQAELAILAAVPDTPEGRHVRNALLRLIHVLESTELDLPLVANWINLCLDDPPSSFWCGPWQARQLADNLENLARELRKATRALDAAKPYWQRFDDSQEGNATDGLSPQENRATPGTATADFGDPPF
jgi:hypothetical protein